MKYDLHMHTHYSKCGNLKPELLLKIAKKRGLDGIAVTDHNTIKGALEVKKLNKNKKFEVIVGEEISTNVGEVLAYYLKKQVKKGDFFSVVDEVKKQGALASLSHPFRTSLNPNHRFKLPIEKIKNRVDAMEVFNARNLPGNNEMSQRTAKKLNLAGTAGSDAHFSFEIAKAYTIFDGNLRQAIKKNETKFKGTIIFGPFGGLLSFLRNRFL
ncbi:PHP domain-containing protein [Candidatus Woesearchaeota archaeon]|nr:PHP domain-containing protein [Candidatus Woesearchaeota archaeon]